MANKSKCSQVFGGAVKVSPTKLGIICRTGNAEIINELDEIVYQLYSCPIVKVDKLQKEAVLDNCGYETKVTKDHLNLALSMISEKRISQRKGKWYLNGGNFKRGMRIDVP